MTNPNATGPIWLDAAKKYLGVTEIKGSKHHPQILKWWKDIGLNINDDETAWCAAFVGGILEECGIKSTRSASARSYNNPKLYKKLQKPAVGAIVVFWRGSPTGWQGHVGFLVGLDQKGNLMVLGGNQKDMVRIDPFDKERVLGYYWPSIAPQPFRYDLPIVRSDGKLSTNEA